VWRQFNTEKGWPEPNTNMAYDHHLGCYSLLAPWTEHPRHTQNFPLAGGGGGGGGGAAAAAGCQSAALVA